MSEAMEAEFDTVARWTEAAVNRLGPDYAIPAACRGSGSPGALRWLGDALGLGPGVRLLDAGAGLGGPAAFAAREFGVAAVLIDPMIGACRAAARLFTLPVVVAGAERIPLRGGTFDAAWSLGVLCTTGGKELALAELRRVLRPGGHLGVLAFVRTVPELPFVPEGNDFPSDASLTALFAATGFVRRAETDAAAFADPPPDWTDRVEAVEGLLAAEHSGDPRWKLARDNQQLMSRLLGSGHVVGRLIHAVAV